MRKLIGILIAASMCLFAYGVVADSAQVLVITLKNDAVASISLDKQTWSPNAGIGQQQATAANAFNLTNNGHVAVDVAIAGVVNATWTLDGSAGNDNLLLTSFYSPATNVTVDEVAGTWETGFVHDAVQPFGMFIRMPTSTSTAKALKINVTFTATAN